MIVGSLYCRVLELVVESAQTIALSGESGSGKSTLLGIIAGLDDGGAGHCAINGTRSDQNE